MRGTKIFAIISFLGAAALILFSVYILRQVEIGKGQVSSAQRTMDVGQKLFSVNPVSKEVGKQLGSPIQNKIAEGSEEIARFENLAHYLLVGGVAFGLIGLGFIIFGRKKHEHHEG